MYNQWFLFINLFIFSLNIAVALFIVSSPAFKIKIADKKMNECSPALLFCSKQWAWYQCVRAVLTANWSSHKSQSMTGQLLTDFFIKNNTGKQVDQLFFCCIFDRVAAQVVPKILGPVVLTCTKCYDSNHRCCQIKKDCNLKEPAGMILWHLAV